MNTKPIYVELPIPVHHQLMQYAHDRFLETGRRPTVREIVVSALRELLTRNGASAESAR